ncbi:tRNA (adenosine(37)-N6)-threonylcarbamoyltransferase complex ATPase subunit type 1 TsaE [Prochlorococcus sp. MIT 1307]|uniref:tRNA (adenosine(37)-N6)-threonylcarbamoyltransferase complex ATPase subunit type 1 TsaE n=1 Tax=Prochlorococcus sp. MIT 1307 TaxID=3096219 RepID=UPI002A75C30A|nr:tRNA (adenosine(37)-N6)-threonylcarbamoyltransferase complex ATPase subunit type 1 TsaE [Prochlorococcus sp. MIT 1307]
MFEASEWSQCQSTDSYWLLQNLEETIALGTKLSERIPDLKILLLEGPLGAGKTSLVKGIASGLGINEPITSPTFPLAQHYPEGNPPLFHLDLYRLEDKEAANELFLQEEEEAEDLGALIVVEWPERLSLSLPEAWKIKLKHHSDGKRLAHVIPPIDPAKNSLSLHK